MDRPIDVLIAAHHGGHWAVITADVSVSVPQRRLDVTSDRYMRLAVSDKCGQFHDPRLNRSGEIRPKVVRGGTLGCFFRTSMNADYK